MRYMKRYQQLRQTNSLRHIARIVVAFVIALVINPFYSMTLAGWMPIATVCVMLTFTGSAFYQGVKHFFVMTLIALIYSLLTHSMGLFSFRMGDVIIGSVLGIALNVLLFPDLVDVEFRRIMIPIIKSYADYFAAIIQLLLQIEPNQAEEKSNIVDERLLTLPRWVYEPGFDITLQKGHRYFTMKVGELYELLMAMHHLARYRFDPALLAAIREPMLLCLTRVEQFFFALLTVLDLQTLQEGVVDFADEIELIEKNFKDKVPLSTEMLDVSKDYVYMAEFIYDLQDFRDAMLKLAQTMR